MSLVKLIAQADERALAASGLACLDRCLPLLAEEPDTLRPLWAGIVSGEGDWSARLAETRDVLDQALDAGATPNVATVLVRTMLGSAPSDWGIDSLRAWADTCSVVALEIHQRFDVVGESVSAAAEERLARCREDGTGADGEGTDPALDGVGPLVAGELRRQIRILDILADTTDPAALRHVMDLSTEGQRVLRAVVSRRARSRG
ncbi:hypothetical protein [Streptomyces sp. NPDC006638]|uniref:hypothetical protein n=1 Tax=Streptomyces sp. NPDC006638 TaxID=3157183 RepID=UPI0033B6D20C